MPAISPSRAELLRALIRRHRARLTRVQIGLPPRPRARGGLTQDDVAEATGYSIQVIGQLENGQLRNPSAHLLAAVATALGLSAQESEDLWLLAAASTPAPTRYTTDTAGDLADLADALDPNPALVTDALWTVQHTNHALARWLPGADHPSGRANFAEWALLSATAGQVFVHRDRELVPLLVANLRTAAARYPDDPRVSGLTQRLRAASPAAAQAWARPLSPDDHRLPRTVTLHQAPDLPAATGCRPGHLSATLTVLTPPSRDDGRILLAFVLPPHRPPLPAHSPGPDPPARGGQP